MAPEAELTKLPCCASAKKVIICRSELSDTSSIEAFQLYSEVSCGCDYVQETSDEQNHRECQ